MRSIVLMELMRGSGGGVSNAPVKAPLPNAVMLVWGGWTQLENCGAVPAVGFDPEVYV